MATRLIGRLLTRVGGIFVLWGPLATLALMGAGYVFDCLNSLSDPGTGLVYEMEGRRGPVVLRAKSYSFAIWTGSLIARNVTITAPSGEIAATADEVDLRLPDYFGGNPRTISTRVKRVRGTVIRNEQGEFSFMDLLPPETKEPSKVAYRIDVEDSILQVIDRQGNETWTRTLRLPWLKIDGIGDNWAAGGRVLSDDGSEAIAAIRSEPNSDLSIQGQFQNFDLSPWVGPVARTGIAKKWELLQKFSAREFRVTGPLLIRLPKQGNAQVEGTIVAHARDARYKDIFAQDGKLEATFNTSELNGWIDLSRPSAKVHYSGRIAWEPEVKLDGHADLALSDRSQVPAALRDKLPRDLSFHGVGYAGIVQFRSKDGLTLHGNGRADDANWMAIPAQDLSFGIHLDRRKLSLRSVHGIYEGISVQGAADLDLSAKTISAFASSGKFPIEHFRAKTGIQNLQGTAMLGARATGSFDHPDIEIRANGQAKAEIEKGRLTALGPFHALGHYKDSIVRVERVAILGPAGLATATGTYDVARRKLDLNAVATGIDLAQLYSKLNGTAAGTFKITGTPDAFTAEGPVEVYGLEINEQPVPLVAAQVVVTPKRILAQEVRASRGAGRLKGTASWTFRSDALDGDFTAESIQLRDFLAEGNEGSIDLTQGSLRGTLSKPVIAGVLSGEDLVVQGVRVDKATGSLFIEDSQVEILSSDFRTDQGSLLAKATYNLRTRNGNVSGRADSIPIDRIQPLLPPDTGIEGELNGNFSATIADGRLGKFEADGGVEGLSVNRAFLGNGFFTLNGADSTWKGTLEVGQPERFIQVPEFTYRREQDTLEADVVAYGIPVRDLYFAARPYFAPEPGKGEPRVDLPRNLRDMLDRLQGSLDVSAHLSGAVTDPNVKIESLLVRNTSIDGEGTGQIQAVATRLDRTWNIEKLQWAGGPGILNITGTVTENGPVALDGDLNNLNTQWLQRFMPSFSGITGSADLLFTVSGQAKSPNIEASLVGSLFRDPHLEEKLSALPVEAREEAKRKAQDQELKLNIYPILVSEGKIELNGNFGFRGFRGDLAGHIPFHYPFTFAKDERMEIALHVPHRPLDELKDLISNLNVNKTEGSVWADVTVAGTSEEVGVSGGVHLEASSLGFDDVDTVLKSVQLDTTLSGRTVELNASAKPEKGGELDAKATVNLKNVASALDEGIDPLLRSQIQGSFSFKQARFDEKNLPLDDYKNHENYLTSAFTANGDIGIRGSLANPEIYTFTPLALTKIKGDIPTLVPSSPGSQDAYVTPRFNVAYVVGTRDEPAEVRAAASVLNMFGTGELKGSLDNLSANANLRVRSGHIRLPSSRINVSEGGTVKLHYAGGGMNSNLRLDVDIEGRTAVSTIRFGTFISRYDIYLQLHGNLLDSEQLTMTARSDPPDLSQEQILNLLGQVELVEKISSNLLGSQEKRSLEQAFTGFALPYVFDPFTEEIARQLGLDYLSLDYGPMGQTSITAARGLGKGFLIQGRREISEPIDRVPDYDLRLIYRPPRKIRQLRNLTFSVGIDQDRPWKISVEYGGRLPNSGAKNKEGRIFIGETPKALPPKSPPDDRP